MVYRGEQYRIIYSHEGLLRYLGRLRIEGGCNNKRILRFDISVIDEKYEIMFKHRMGTQEMKNRILAVSEKYSAGEEICTKKVEINNPTKKCHLQGKVDFCLLKDLDSIQFKKFKL